jgi:hypothetical protein
VGHSQKQKQLKRRHRGWRRRESNLRTMHLEYTLKMPRGALEEPARTGFVAFVRLDRLGLAGTGTVAVACDGRATDMQWKVLLT